MRIHSSIRILAVLMAAAWSFGGTGNRGYAQPWVSAYYVSPDGDDARDGQMPQHAWRTLARVNAAAIAAPGTKVLFRRGGEWRGQLIPRNGVTYGAYGDGGPKPALLGSVALNDPADWQAAGENRWITATPPKAKANALSCDVGNIIFNGGAAWGIKKWSAQDLKKDLEYCYDAKTKTITLISAKNPARRFRSVELALCKHIIDESGKNNVVYENLALRYGAAHGIGGGGTHHITVRDCDISWIGGGHQHTRADGVPVRYGNGVEFWGNAHDNLVERCRLWQIYDAALTNQSTGKVVQQVNITYRHNIIWNSEYSFEYWSHPAASQTHHITFEHNTCVGAGFGWSHAQRPDPNGRQICFYTNDAETRDFVIRDNIFCGAATVAFDAPGWNMKQMSDQSIIRLDHNCWFQPEGTMIRINRGRPGGAEFRPGELAERTSGKAYTQGRFADYQRDTGQEARSVAADPRFVDPAQQDFRLRPDSPCAGIGAIKASAPHAGKLKVMQCWDDSLATDRPLVKLLKKYHAKATFNIIPLKERRSFFVKKPNPKKETLFAFTKPGTTVRYMEGFKVDRMTNEEMKEALKGFTVAGHCNISNDDTTAATASRRRTLADTKALIKEEFGQDKAGFVYPGGRTSKATTQAVREAGYRYARTTKSVDAPLPLDNPFELPSSCHWNSSQFWKKYEDAKTKGGVFYFWGHSCELGDEPFLWDKLEGIYARISADPDAEWIDVIDLF